MEDVVRREVAFTVFIFFISICTQGQPEFFSKIRALRSEGKYEQAYQQIDTQLKILNPNSDRDPDSQRLLLFTKGLVAVELGKLDEAEASFRELAQTKHRLSENTFFELSQLLIKKNSEESKKEAMGYLESILKLSPNIKMQNEVQFKIAQYKNDTKKFKEAKSFLIKQEKKNRREEIYPDLLYELARAEKGLHNQGPFCKWIRKLYAHYPEYHRVSNWGFHLSKNEFESSETQCQVTSEDKKLRIKNLQWAGLSSKAADEITALQQGTESERAEADRLYISYLMHEGEVEKALQILKPIYENRKSDPNYLMTIGNISARLGDSQAAIGSFYEAYKKSGKGKFGRQALYQAAFTSYQVQDYDGAARKFQEFMKVFPGSGLTKDARWHLAWIRYLRGDYHGALKALNELSKMKKSKSYSKDRVQYWTAMCLYRLGHMSEARTIFENLSTDKLLGFYSIASSFRLSKVNEQLPKTPKHILVDPSMKTSIHSKTEALMPTDDPNWYLENAHQISETENAESTKNTNVSTAEENESEQDFLKSEEERDRGQELADLNEEERVSNISNPELVKRFERARDLMVVGLSDWAKWDLYDIERKTSNKDYLKTLMQEYEVVENFQRSSYIGQVYFGGLRSFLGLEGNRTLWEHTYPRAYAGYVNKYAREFSIPTELIWGIMRAESQYKKDVVSPVGALGLMQVMPFTGRKVASLLGEKDFEPKKLMIPEVAIKWGGKYLQRLMKKFESQVALVAAAYNAGPHRVSSWVSSFGSLDLDEFIEHIPYLETRNYVKKVVGNYFIYSKLYNNKKENQFNLSESLNVRISEGNVTKETWEDI